MYSLAKMLTAVLLLSMLLALGCSSSGGDTLYNGRQGDALNTGKLLSSNLVREVAREMDKGTIVPDQLMIKFTSDVTEKEAIEFLDNHHLDLIKQIPEIGYYNVAIAPDATLQDTAAAIADDASVAVCEPVYIQKAFDTSINPNDAHFSDQWGLFKINAPKAWVIEPGFVDPPAPGDVVVNDVMIAVLDTGVDYQHEDLNPSQGQDNVKFIEGLNLISNGKPYFDPMDDNGHGTMVAGIAAALTDNTYGIASVSWHARICAIKVLDSQGFGTSATSADGIVYAANQYVNAMNLSDPYDGEAAYFNNPFNARLIINMSYGFERLNSEGELSSEADAIAYAVSKGAILVAAAGDQDKPVDDGISTTYPAGNPDVIAVGAIDQANGLFTSSNRPSINTPLDQQAFLVAPGKDIISSSLHGFGEPYSVGNGTSFAAPFVSGTVALIWSQYPFLSPSQVKNLLRDSANSDAVGTVGIDSTTGWGLVDAYAALQQAFTPFEDDMIVRAFTSPVLHGDILFAVRTKFRLMDPPEVAFDGVDLINNGFPISYNIGWDDNNDGAIDETIEIDTKYFPNEVVFFKLDDATYLGRVHLMQDLGMKLGTLIIEVVGVPKNFLNDPTLPKTISGNTSIEITDFNYS